MTSAHLRGGVGAIAALVAFLCFFVSAASHAQNGTPSPRVQKLIAQATTVRRQEALPEFRFRPQKSTSGLPSTRTQVSGSQSIIDIDVNIPPGTTSFTAKGISYDNSPGHITTNCSGPVGLSFSGNLPAGTTYVMTVENPIPVGGIGTLLFYASYDAVVGSSTEFDITQSTCAGTVIEHLLVTIIAPTPNYDCACAKNGDEGAIGGVQLPLGNLDPSSLPSLISGPGILQMSTGPVSNLRWIWGPDVPLLLPTVNGNNIPVGTEVEWPNGRTAIFAPPPPEGAGTPGAWVSSPDITSQLSYLATPNANGAQFILTAEDGSVTQLNATGHPVLYTTRSGSSLHYTYPTSGDAFMRAIPIKIADNFGNSIGVALNETTFTFTFTAPDGQAYTLTPGASSETFQNPDGTSKQYLCENTAFPLNPTGLIDENGNRLFTWGYDANGRVNLVQRGVGTSGVLSQYSFSYGINTVTVTDPLGTQRTLTYQDDGFGNLLLVNTTLPCEECGHNIQSKVLGTNGLMTQSTDFRGNVTLHGWDSANQLQTSITPPGLPATTTSWNVNLRKPTQINEPGRTTTFSYDGVGNLTQKVVTDTASGKSQTWNYTNSATGQVLTATDPNGNITTYTYDSSGNLTRVTDALGRQTQYQNNANGQVTQKTDPNGLVTTYSYDSRERLTGKAVGAEQYGYGYDAASNLTSVALPSGYSATMTYDIVHRLIGMKDVYGNSVKYTLDGAGNHLSESHYSASNTLVYSHSWVFDSLDRLAQDIGATSQTTAYQYDGNSNRISVTDPLNRVTQNTYDPLDRLTQSQAPDSSTVAYGYNPLSQLTSVTDPKRLTTNYTIDALGNTSQIASPDSGTSAFITDAAGNVTARTDAKGQKLLYQYDALNRVTQISRGDTNQVLTTFTYDQNDSAHGFGIGRLTSMTDLSGSTNWDYDIYGHILSKSSVAGGHALVSAYSYDGPSGNLLTATLPSGKVIGYTWTSGRITALTLGGSPLVSSIAYQPFGGPSSWTLANGEVANRSYDLDGRIVSDPVETISYDAASRVTGWTQSNLSALGGSQVFGYDNKDRITSYTGTGGPISYGYDANGNRQTQTVNGTTTAYTVDSASNRITARDSKSLSYDANGSLTALGAANLSYDVQGHLSAFNLPLLSSGSYVYNGGGQRVSKTSGSTTTLFAYDESGHLIGEYSSSGSPNWETIYLGDMPVAVTKPLGTYYVHADYRNAPRQVDNANKTPVWEWDPTPFGDNQPNEHPSLFTLAFNYNLRYPGQYYDSESTANNNLFRDYYPAMGRYIESDPIGLRGGINTYAYVGGNPVGRIDSSGLVPNPAEGTCVEPIDNPICYAGVIADLAEDALAIARAAKTVAELCNKCKATDTRSEAQFKAWEWAGLFSSNVLNNIPWTNLNLPGGSGFRDTAPYADFRSQYMSPPYGTASPNGGMVEEHPFGHPDLPGGLNHDCPHFLATNPAGDKREFPYKPGSP